MKKFLALTLSLLLLSILVVACANDAPEPGTPADAQTDTPPPDTDETISGNLTFMTWDAYADETFGEVIENFNNYYPEVNVTISSVGFGDYWVRMTTTLMADDAPDVFWLNYPYAINFIPTGRIMDLTDIGIDFTQFASNLYEPFSYEGKKYGIPFNLDVVVMYFNKHMFDEAGLEHPEPGWTWDDFLHAAQELTIRSDDDQIIRHGVTLLFDTQSGFPIFVYSNGGRILNDEGTESIMHTDPLTIEALQFMNDLAWKYRVAPTQPEFAEMQAQGIDLFMSGMAAMTNGGAWVFAIYQEHMGDALGMTSMPRRHTPESTLHNLAYSASEATNYRAATEAFMNFLATPRVSQLLSQNYVPADFATQTTFFEANPEIQVMQEILLYARPLTMASVNPGPVFSNMEGFMFANVFNNPIVTVENVRAADEAINAIINAAD